MNFIPFGQRILVEPIIEKHVGVLEVAPTTKQNELSTATVIAVSQDVKTISVGDIIYKGKFTGIDIEIDGKKYKVVSIPDVLGKLG